jgi:hypothetical protein
MGMKLFTPKIAKLWLFWENQPSRFPETGHDGFENFVKLQIRLHHCVLLMEIIEIHIYNVQFKVQMRELRPVEIG